MEDTEDGGLNERREEAMKDHRCWILNELSKRGMREITDFAVNTVHHPGSFS